jgi:hypothetical protein
MSWKAKNRLIKSYIQNTPNALSQLCINLAAGWFALVLIAPGLEPINDFGWLLKNLFFGIVALVVAIIISKKGS